MGDKTLNCQNVKAQVKADFKALEGLMDPKLQQPFVDHAVKLMEENKACYPVLQESPGLPKIIKTGLISER